MDSQRPWRQVGPMQGMQSAGALSDVGARYFDDAWHIHDARIDRGACGASGARGGLRQQRARGARGARAPAAPEVIAPPPTSADPARPCP